MNKSNLVAKIVSLNPDLYQKDVIKIVDIFFRTITKAIVKNDRVELRGFGTFDIKNSALMPNFKFYSQFISYECGQNTPIIIEELLAEKPFGKGIKNNSKKELKKAQNLISVSYPSLFKETCI